MKGISHETWRIFQLDGQTLQNSVAFYGDLGFTRFGGADEHNYAITAKKWRHFAGLYQACLNVIC
jgi:hypothetical protein